MCIRAPSDNNHWTYMLTMNLLGRMGCSESADVWYHKETNTQTNMLKPTKSHYIDNTTCSTFNKHSSSCIYTILQCPYSWVRDVRRAPLNWRWPLHSWCWRRRTDCSLSAAPCSMTSPVCGEREGEESRSMCTMYELNTVTVRTDTTCTSF